MNENEMYDVSQVAHTIHRAVRGDIKDKKAAEECLATGLLLLFGKDEVTSLCVMFGESAEMSIHMARVIRRAHDALVRVQSGEDVDLSAITEETYDSIKLIPDEVFEKPETKKG